MSDHDKDGGPAYPCLDDSGSGAGLGLRHAGMSLRDFFAANAMQALVSGLCAADGRSSGNWTEADLWAPEMAYRIADAMLRARNK